MNQRNTTDWESKWASQRRHEQIATERLQLEEDRHLAGWRRNLVVVAALLVVASIFLLRHFF